MGAFTSDWRKTIAYMIGTLPFVVACTLWNLLGLALSLYLGAFPLFFDMTGTAVASLSRGLGYGVFVALLSNAVPALFYRLVGFSLPQLDPEVYLWFGFTNAVGAIVWAAAPRVIVYVQRRGQARTGFLSTNPFVGYRTLMQQILLVGIIVGGAATVAACFTQYVALDCRPGAGMTACSESGPAMRVAKALVVSLGWSDDTVGLVYYGVLLLYNLPDKIVATASAMMIVFTFHPVPNYYAQRERLLQFERKTGSSPRSFRVAWIAYLLTCTIFSAGYAFLLFSRWSASMGTMFVYIVSVMLLFMFLLRPKGLPLHSVFYRPDGPGADLYHDRTEVSRQSVHRDVFEDLLKTSVVFVMIVSLLMSAVEGSVAGTAASATSPLADHSAGQRQTLLNVAAPILLLTLWRYFLVFLGRYQGVLYARERADASGAAVATAAPGRAGAPAG